MSDVKKKAEEAIFSAAQVALIETQQKEIEMYKAIIADAINPVETKQTSIENRLAVEESVSKKVLDDITQEKQSISESAKKLEELRIAFETATGKNSRGITSISNQVVSLENQVKTLMTLFKSEEEYNKIRKLLDMLK